MAGVMSGVMVLSVCIMAVLHTDSDWGCTKSSPISLALYP